MEVIEGTSTLVDEQPVPRWAGTTPFYLVFEPIEGGQNTGIDIDFGGWIEANRELLRRTGTWFLVSKATNQPLFVVVIHPGDQIYFVKHHVGNLMGVGREIVAIGLGKKAVDGTMTRLWLLPNGMVCGGDDVDDIATRMM